MTAGRAARTRSAPAGRGAATAGRPAAPLITVDVGNTETTVGRFRGAELEESWRLTSGRTTADELRLTLEAMLGSSGSAAASVLCSVVPALTGPWREALQGITGRAPLEVSSKHSPIPLDVTEPDSVGPDRIANAFAGRTLHGSPCIVVDLGTATTFDCVSKQGAFVGGAIAPGLSTAAEELFRRAARLSNVELRRPERAVARTTAENLRVGVLWGYAGLVDALVRRMRSELGGRPKVIATGGLARMVAPECETVDLVDDGLTLKGLQMLWEASR